MHFTHLPAATVTLAFLLPTHLLAVTLPDHFTCNVDQAPLSTDWAHALYTFTLDATGEAVAKANGANTVHVTQWCKSQKLNPWGPLLNPDQTYNHGYAKLNGFGPNHQYTVKLDRCKKGADRQPVAYSVKLCSGNDEGTWCGNTVLKCGPSDWRGVCAVQETKAVNATDMVPWSCYRSCVDNWGGAC
ncbi:uncharacterized protein LY79DRAFT_614358 [Colletotrichum navitas]|uniref:Uncharacterized protein n=1 Tax=Colletotrichum navitas TaxID=681940 RepID=A0AAD8V1W9_9PEZI|nr:uncharacterized protein LY79DRAFT_614358 [Colletotrichum navitas]KAK1574785.1 hypothetical protein LY79DRAFT_614358 [Colletotrichum navitas]